MKKYLRPKADSVFMAFRILEADGKITQGSTDDSEYFGDLEIRSVLEERKVVNVVLFVSREQGGGHIGPVRFKIIRAVTEEVLDKLKCDTIPKNQRSSPAKSRRRASRHEDID